MSLILGSFHLSLGLSIDKNPPFLNYINKNYVLVCDFNFDKTAWNMLSNKSVEV